MAILKESRTVPNRVIDIGMGGVIASVVLPPFLLMAAFGVFGDVHEEHAHIVVVGSVPVSPARMAELNRTLDELLPLFALPDGKPLKRPALTIEACVEHASAVEYDDENRIGLCAATADYPQARLVRVLKHELIHAWIAQSGIKDNSSHGNEFMKKAIEVGTLPVDEQ